MIIENSSNVKKVIFTAFHKVLKNVHTKWWHDGENEKLAQIIYFGLKHEKNLILISGII